MPAITIGPRVRKSPFYDATIRHGARSFTIYNHMFMPMIYEADPTADYSNLLNGVQIWDVACERQVQISGPDTMRLAQLLTPRNLSKCAAGQCMYGLVTDHDGGIINDPVLLRLADQHVWFSLSDSDMLLWVKAIAASNKLDVNIDEPDVSPLQIQGPRARDLLRDVFGDWVDELNFFWLRETELDGMPLVVARTGYSKELCYEVFLRDGQYGDRLWNRLFDAGAPYNVSPGAPNQILRVEGGFLSYNTEMDLSNNPYEVNLGWTVDLEQSADFIGKEALAKIKGVGVKQRLLGVVLDGAKMTQFNQEPWPVFVDDAPAGHMTTCAYSPRLEQNLGFVMAKIEFANTGQGIEIRSPDGSINGTLCELPFIKERQS